MVDMGWPGKVEAGHASRSSGLVQITAARCANGRAKPWAVNLSTHASHGGTATADGRMEMADSEMS